MWKDWKTEGQNELTVARRDKQELQCPSRDTHGGICFNWELQCPSRLETHGGICFNWELQCPSRLEIAGRDC